MLENGINHTNTFIIPYTATKSNIVLAANLGNIALGANLGNHKCVQKPCVIILSCRDLTETNSCFIHSAAFLTE